jgi:hypothetical protein
MGEPSRWLEDASSTDADSTRIRQHLERLIAGMIQIAARRHGDDAILRVRREDPLDPVSDDAGTHQPERRRRHEREALAGHRAGAPSLTSLASPDEKQPTLV